MEVVSNASSDDKEWTVDQFQPIKARFVKVTFHSSNDDPSQWANLWEAEIWGNNSDNMKRMSKTNESNDDNSSTPEKFELQQNYPNPFNPSTTIKFQMASDGNVMLVVYNILGEKVAELINRDMSAGTHSVVFDASRLASGTYIYLLNVEDQFTSTKKMLLIK